MPKPIADSLYLVDSKQPGPTLAFSFGVHGDERPPIDAGLRLRSMLESGEIELERGRLLLVHANPRASEQGRRWSEGGIDLNRCFSPASLAAEPEPYEQRRAREIVDDLERLGPESLVDFHCTVEPGDPFLMQHPPADHAPSRAVSRLLSADVLLSDPKLHFGAVSLDEWMTTRGRVGICYETGWLGAPECTPEKVLQEMLNVLAGHQMLRGREPVVHDDKTRLRLESVLRCDGAGFTWAADTGTNLQALAGGTVLGRYDDGRELRLPHDATLIFPKKRPELLQAGQPLVYLAVPAD